MVLDRMIGLTFSYDRDSFGGPLGLVCVFVWGFIWKFVWKLFQFLLCNTFEISLQLDIEHNSLERIGETMNLMLA